MVLGPWYAKWAFIGLPNVILLDRAYYRPDPINVAFGWMDLKGNLIYNKGEGRSPPRIDQNCGEGTIYLCDYDGPIEQHDAIRYHPSAKTEQLPLKTQLAFYKNAIGYRTTALVTAGIMGLNVTTRDPSFVMNFPNWLELIPYVDWGYDEIKSGEAWSYLNEFNPIYSTN